MCLSSKEIAVGKHFVFEIFARELYYFAKSSNDRRYLSFKNLLKIKSINLSKYETIR